MSCKTCGMISRSPWVSSFRTLLLCKLQELLDVKDLTAAELHRLEREDVQAGLQKLKPFIELLLILPEKLPQELVPGQTRVALVAGSKLWKPVAERAASLYEDRLVDRIIVSGHQGKLEASEAELMQGLLMHKGVLGECIVLDTEASNTSENMRNMLNLYVRYFLDKDVVIVGKDYHTARMLTAFHDQFVLLPKKATMPTVYLAHTNVYGDAWLQNPDAVRAIVGEVFRLCRHHRHGIWIGCSAKAVFDPQLESLTKLTL